MLRTGYLVTLYWICFGTITKFAWIFFSFHIICYSIYIWYCCHLSVQVKFNQKKKRKLTKFCGDNCADDTKYLVT